MKKIILFLCVSFFFGCEIYKYNQMNKPLVIVFIQKPSRIDTFGFVMFKDALNYYGEFTGKNHIIRSHIKHLIVGDTIK